MFSTVSKPSKFIGQSRPCILSIGGSDSSGLSGIQMDLRTANAFNVHCATAITANTAQNNQHVTSINPTSAQILAQQIAATSDLNPSIIKISLINTREQLDVITQHLKTNKVPSIYDPVLTSSSGTYFSDSSLTRTLIEQLLPHVSLITPNISEAEQLSNLKISSPIDIKMAAQRLLKMGCNNILIKGGHLNGTWAQDYFCNHDRDFWLNLPKLNYHNTRGTGCAFASAICASMSLGYSILDAIVIAKMAVHQGLRNSYQIQNLHPSTAPQKGPVCITEFPCAQRDLPYITKDADFDIEQPPFPDCTFPRTPHSEIPYLKEGHPPLGVYPVVDSSSWVSRLLPLGITTIQLRIKHLNGEALSNEIEKAIKIAHQYTCRIFINDHWQVAIEKGAYGVHLGQEDLENADIPAIHKAGLRLGISTHCHFEVAKAHSYKPSYIACGPVFPTTTKDMPWTPHGISGLKYWQKCLDYPLVAIGGINTKNIQDVAQSKVSGIALITAITHSITPEKTTKTLIETSSNANTTKQ